MLGPNRTVLPPAEVSRPGTAARSSRRAALMGAAGLIAGPLAFAWWRLDRVERVTEPRLAVDPAALRLGTVWAKPEHRVVVPVRNLSAGPVEVGVRPSCSCTAAAPESFTLAPGETRPVELTFDFHPFRPNQAAESTRPFRSVLALHSPDRPSPESFPIEGEIRNLLVGLPRVDFDGADALISDAGPDHVARPITLTLEPHPGVTGLRLAGPAVPLGETDGGGFGFDPPVRAGAASDDAAFDYAPDPAAPVALLEPADDGAYRLTVTPPRLRREGRFAFALPVTAETDDGEFTSAPAIAVRGEYVSDLEVLPNAPRLPVAAVGASAATTVRLRSRTGRPFRLLAAAADGAAVELGDDAGEPAVAHAVAVTRLRVPPGPYEHALELSTDRGRRVVPVRGHGSANPRDRPAAAVIR